MLNADRDIFRLCIPLAAGVLSAALIFKAGAGISASGYRLTSAIASVTFCMAGLCGSLVYSGNSTGRCTALSKAPPLWIGMFFILGAFSYFTRLTVLPSLPDRSCFTGVRSALCGTIDALPFSDKENNALVKALTVADRSGLSRDTTMAFRKAGAAHLLALSGMHLGIIYLIVRKMLFFTGNAPAARRVRSAIVVTVTGLYTLLCGSGESLVRAWLFILLHEGGRMLGRPQRPQDVLCSALTIHLIFRPESINSVGFQLSYLAMVGIVFIWPHVRKWMGGKIWAALSLSICCQLFTAPLTLYYFGTFPKYFLITNLFVAPLTTVVMGSSLISIGISILAPSLWELDFLAGILEFPLSAMRWLLTVIASL